MAKDRACCSLLFVSSALKYGNKRRKIANTNSKGALVTIINERLPMESTNTNAESATPILLPVLICSGIVSIVCSFFISNYFGMGLAIGTAIAAFLGLRNVSRSARNWVMGLCAIGFFVGFSALLMKIFMMNADT